MEKKIKFIDLQLQDTFSELIDQSFRLFSDIEKVNYKKIDKKDVNYFAIHLRQPFDIDEFFQKIPNDIFLLMQQNIIRPLIIMITEQWDLFDTYAWRYNKLNLIPDFGEIPFSKMIRKFTSRGIAEENITWMVPDNNHIDQIKFLRNKGYKISCNFIQLDFFKEVMKGVACGFEIEKRNFKKYFNCLCRGTPRNHRYGIIYNIWKKELLSKGNVSCENYKVLLESKESNWLDDGISTDMFMSQFEDWEYDKKNFIEILPLTFDDKTNQHWQNLEDYNESSMFLESFLWISNETKKTHEGIYITEKTWKSIAYGSPFCINGDSGSLKYLKDIGFKTFEKFWDESYDNDNDIEKIKKITKIVQDVCGKTLDQLNDLYVEMLPILKYNQEQLKNCKQFDNTMKVLKNV